MSPTTQEKNKALVLEAFDALFNRRDSVDRAWELIQPVLQVWEATPGVQYYDKGSKGPQGADDMLAKAGHSWRELQAK